MSVYISLDQYVQKKNGIYLVKSLLESLLLLEVAMLAEDSLRGDIVDPPQVLDDLVHLRMEKYGIGICYR